MPEVITIDEQIACVQRERAMRLRTYPRWVKTGKLTQGNADLELCRMDAVLATLEGVRAGQDARVPDAAEIRRSERAHVMAHVLHLVPSSLLIRIEHKLRAIPQQVTS